jgi:spore maturation protein CgeB
MRVLTVSPGADFSVADVDNGYVKAFKALGCDVARYNMNDRLVYFANVELAGRKLEHQEVVLHAANGLHGMIWEWWPDLIVVISGFYVRPFTWAVLKDRPHKTAIVFTESPYEDDRQLNLVREAEPDVVILNDPKNRERYDQIHGNVHYLGHCYDPDIHHPPTARRDVDFAFVGTGYPSRARFFEQVDWTGLNVKLAGHWKDCPESLERFVIHDRAECYDNQDTANLYRRSRVSANLYRGHDPVEANSADLMDGWACGPREIELAACETFFLREPRGESDRLFPMLPTFDTPDDFSQQLRWALAHPFETADAGRRARAAIHDRTFVQNARRLLQLADD